MTDFTLPELGENISTGDVLRVLVKAGDTIQKEQSVLELETDKATIEVPSSVAGTVTAVKVKAGDKVKVGQPVLTVDANGSGSSESTAVAANTSEKVPADGGLEQHVEGLKRPAEEKSGAKKRSTTEDAEATQAAKAGLERAQAPEAPASRGNVVDIRGARPSADAAAPEMPPAPAAPSVRRMARELGVDINEVAGTGEAGR